MASNYPPGYFSNDPRDHQWTEEEVEAWQEARAERLIEQAENRMAETGRTFPF